MTTTTTLLPFQPANMTPAQLAAVSFLARYSGHTHVAYAYQLRRWFSWCEDNGLDPLIGIQRGHVELYIQAIGDPDQTPIVQHSVSGCPAHSDDWLYRAVRNNRRLEGLPPQDCTCPTEEESNG